VANLPILIAIFQTDSRVQAIAEAVSVMRMIKLFGWEKKVIGGIEGKRDQELSWIWKIMVLKIFNNLVGYVACRPLSKLFGGLAHSLTDGNTFDLNRMLITSSTIFITYAVYTAVMKEELNGEVHSPH
jgi:hypothetical protein